MEQFLNKIILGNCIDVVKQFPDKYFDCVIMDPPYGLEYDYSEYIDTKENLKSLINNIFPTLFNKSKRIITFCGVQNVWLYPESDWIMSYAWNTTAKYGKFGYNQWQPILLYGKDIKGFGSVNEVLKSDSIKYSGGGRYRIFSRL